jgi:hypothetical protein
VSAAEVHTIEAAGRTWYHVDRLGPGCWHEGSEGGRCLSLKGVIAEHTGWIWAQARKELAAECSCGSTYETYQGPEPHCPVHGAVRAFHEAQAAVERVRALIDDPDDRRPEQSRVVHHRWIREALAAPEGREDDS